MIASAPPSTAPAASLASARVGRGSVRIDSSTCVATITGTPRARALRRISFCTRGTRSSGISSPRSPRATITASDDVEDFVEAIDRFGPLELRDQRHFRPAFGDQHRSDARDVVGRLHEAQRDHVDAEGQPEREVALVFLGHVRLQRHARRIDALVLAELAALDHSRVNLRRRRRLHLQLHFPIVQEQAIALRHFAGQLAVSGGDPARAAHWLVADRDDQRVALRERNRAAVDRAGRCGSSGR